MSKYKVGDKVRIVSEWNEKTMEDAFGSMDKWLGKVMTIRKIDNMLGKFVYKMEEDKNEGDSGWAWNEACIAGLANKFNVGERYKVDYDGIPEAGNIIEITGIGKGYRIYYKTIKGNHDRYYDKFDERSNFANSLIPVTEQSDSTKKIVITTDGKTTTAKMYDGKSCIKVSESRCCPSDAFDFQTGAEIAFNRLFFEPKNEFNWNAFKSQNLAVIVTRETIKSFLSEAENHGCVWRSGTNPTEWNPAEEYELEKTYLYGIKNRDDFGEFGWCTVRPFKKVCVVEW